MDDARRFRHRPHWAARVLLSLGLLMTLIVPMSNSGCSLGVMAGKMLFGDPMKTCEFTQVTGVDLTKDMKRVVVLCTVPSSAQSSYAALDMSLVDGITTHLKRKGVEVVKQNDVATWIDDHGGLKGDPADSAARIAQDFDVDYVLHVAVENYSDREPESANLYRGHANALLTAFQVSAPKKGGHKQTLQVFVREFSTEYPKHNPVPADTQSPAIFQKRFVDRLSLQFAQHYYNHRMSEEIDAT